jgi:hypothetical protein
MLPASDGSEAVLFATKPCIGNAPHELALVSISWLYVPLIPFASLRSWILGSRPEGTSNWEVYSTIFISAAFLKPLRPCASSRQAADQRAV